MEFDKSRVFTALNADELKRGDKVFVADQLSVLKQRVQEGKKNSAIVLQKINGEDWGRRFGLTMSDFALAYLVERAENCTNCDTTCMACIKPDKTFRCEDYSPKTEKKAEKKNCYNCRLTYTRNGVMRCMMNDQRCNNPEVACYHHEPKTEKHCRPFKDTDELIGAWKNKMWGGFNKNTMPLIWVRSKFNKDHKGVLINNYFGEYVELGKVQCFLSRLFDEYTFLDGTICGVEE